jgi:hypothetical protein
MICKNNYEKTKKIRDKNKIKMDGYRAIKNIFLDSKKIRDPTWCCTYELKSCSFMHQAPPPKLGALNMYIFKGLCDEFKLDINTLYT